MEITEHQANMLRALADGKRMQVIDKRAASAGCFDITTLDNFMLFITDSDRYEVRIKPDVIVVNGIEVPAGVTKAPAEGDLFYTASPGHPDWISTAHWYGDENQELRLARGLVYTDRTACELRSKAMAAHMPG